jgi:hypothetical protein
LALPDSQFFPSPQKHDQYSTLPLSSPTSLTSSSFSATSIQLPSLIPVSKKDNYNEFKEEINNIIYSKGKSTSSTKSSTASGSPTSVSGRAKYQPMINGSLRHIDESFPNHTSNAYYDIHFERDGSPNGTRLSKYDMATTMKRRPASNNGSNISSSSSRSTTPRTPRTLPTLNSSPSDFTLITVLTQRLTDLEQQHAQTLAKLKEQELTSNKWRKQCQEMEIFLSDYGLTWIGEQSQLPQENKGDQSPLGDPTPAKGSVNGRELSEPRQFNLLPNPSYELTHRNFSIPNISQLRKCVKELNSSVTNSQMRFVKDQHSNAIRLSPPLTIPLILYSNGLKLHNLPFRSYSLHAVQAVFADILDNYFPTELKDEFPEGVLLEIIDKLGVDYLEDDEPALFIPFSGKGVKVMGDIAGPDELSYRNRAHRKMEELRLKPQLSTLKVKPQPTLHSRIRDGNVYHLGDKPIVASNVPQIGFAKFIPDNSIQLLIRIDSSAHGVIIIGRNETMHSLCKTLHVQYPKLKSIAIRLWPNTELGPISLDNLDESTILFTPLESLGIKDKVVLRIRSH